MISRVLFFQFPAAASRLLPPASRLPPPPPLSHIPSLSTAIFHTLFFTHTIFQPGRGRCRGHDGTSAAGAGTPKNACLPFRNHSRRHAAVRWFVFARSRNTGSWKRTAPPSSTLRDRRNTWSHPLSFCVIDMVLMVLGWLWWRV